MAAENPAELRGSKTIMVHMTYIGRDSPILMIFRRCQYALIPFDKF